MSSVRPWVLGISASHNGGCCLLHGDELTVAIQEERLSRWKRHKVYPGQPFLSLNYCLEAAGITVRDLDAVAICAQGHASAEANDPRANPALAEALERAPLFTIGHHLGHAISAFATSGHDEAAILIVDGVGSPLADLTDAERGALVTAAAGHEAISLYRASGTTLEPLEKHMTARHIDRSQPGLAAFGTLGMMFGAVALHVFGNGLDAGKVMGLAPYGERAFARDQFFELDGEQIRFTNTICDQFRVAERWPAHAGSYQDLARSAQEALEEALLWLAARLAVKSSSQHLCYGGGVALNSIANERLIRESGFGDIYIVPAAEDSGPAIGAAYHALWQLTERWTPRRMIADAVGRDHSEAEIEAALERTPGVTWEERDDVVAHAADLLEQGQILGWFQGRSELGPRALGSRSIVMDPRRADGKDVLNARVKFREAFRPFAPVVLLEHAADWFELDGAPADSPFMLRVCRFRPERAAQVPAVVHVDGTGRLQTVTAPANGRFHELVDAFYRRTGVPIVLNTSFNVMGEPIVETPDDALWSLLSTGIDGCVLGRFVARRAVGFRRVLDLKARVVGVRANATAAADEPTDFGESSGSRMVEFEVPTRWGTCRQRAPRDYIGVLDWADGERTGWEIYRAMSEARHGLNEKFVELALTRLRRARIIDFVR